MKNGTELLSWRLSAPEREAFSSTTSLSCGETPFIFPLWNEFISFKISVAECWLDFYSLAKVCWSCGETCSTVKLRDEVYGQVSDKFLWACCLLFVSPFPPFFFPSQNLFNFFPVSTLVAWCQYLGCSEW